MSVEDELNRAIGREGVKGLSPRWRLSTALFKAGFYVALGAWGGWHVMPAIASLIAAALSLALP